jgi:asparagine synthase (glutamine-hydrolysing)
MPRAMAEAQLRRMVQSICHESFYESGTWIDEAAGVYVGWVARKNSFSHGMPVRNETGDVTLIFSGEEFPEPGTAQCLQQKGHDFNSSGPDYLVHLYEEQPNFPASLNGRFQGLVIDTRRGTTTLFNDRYGMHRVYYHESKDAFYFAAEAKAILEVRPELRRVDDQGLGEFVACGCVLENRTLFKGIYVLPPGSAWIFEGGRSARKASYFQPKEWEEQERLDPESYYKELRGVFARNLSRYFDCDERVGLSLTGGLDSRMILAWQKPAPQTLPCYTFGGTYRDCQDVVVSRAVARECKQPYEVIPVGAEFLSNFGHYAERAVYLTDGCVRVNRSADLYGNERAREIAPVRMTGNYGSEVLRWVPAFKPSRQDSGLFSNDFFPFVQSANGTYQRILEGHPVSFAVFRQAPWHHYGLLALEQTQLSIRTPYLDNELVRTVFRSPKPSLAKVPMNGDVCMRLIGDGNARLGSIRTDRGLGGSNGVSATALRHILDFTFKAEYAYDSGMPQWMARADHSFSGLRLERLFLGWHKFSHFRIWYRDTLAEYVRQTLLDPRSLSRPYLQGKRMEEMVESHLKGKRNHTNDIHLLLTLELIHRLFLDSR